MTTSDIKDKPGMMKVAVLDGAETKDVHLYYESPDGNLEEIKIPRDWPKLMCIAFLKKKGFRVELV